ncbi:Cytoplasmic beta-galactosidase1 [Chondrus crispus]|uniref:beta-galactosidase n=1 Tax=Chondrus crispus TaxID=2769 RepID=R7QR83_CHOCR|nr:Cytoplasmic beta-galactosidase1 [Chondrus crispus]CDF40977.1 Cytoplasmic beta-galactosidase1 [Chondrus crispus]|eukprot:XP_005711271.1 Cytoplasmic beta-galactosidase1 [Chondrus crispus]
MSSSVTYDRRSFFIHGEPFLILCGSVHYIRLHPSRWDALFDTFHRAGLNTLETYVFWGEHDGAPPVTAAPSPTPHARPSSYDFSGRRDLFAFLRAASSRSLKVILRIGPYVCAEVSYGGFPSRLRFVPDIEFRTYNTAFMDEVATWVRYVATQLKEEKLMLPQGGPVMLVQLENEYSMVSDAYGDVGGKYLQWCADLQKELEFGVPGIMCYGAAEGVVETINSFYAHEEIDGHRQRHADQPPVWTECWTGWYNVWGAAKHVRKAEDLAYAVARWFAQGGAGVNYYMWMGGTNFGRSAMYLQATSYGYDAPVNEFYQETSKMRHLARLHRVLKDKFERAFMATREQDAECVGRTVYRWGDAVFVCNDSDEQLTDVCIEGVEGKYTGVVAAKSVSIIDGFSGELLYDSSSIHGDDVVTQELVAAPVVAGDWASMSEPVPSWDNIEAISEASGGESRPVVSGASPPDQLMLTQDSSDFCFYVAKYRSVGEGKGKRKVEFEAGDYATVFCDGKMQG